MPGEYYQRSISQVHNNEHKRKRRKKTGSLELVTIRAELFGPSPTIGCPRGPKKEGLGKVAN